jgi:hypothetical protein
LSAFWAEFWLLTGCGLAVGLSWLIPDDSVFVILPTLILFVSALPALFGVDEGKVGSKDNDHTD